MGVVFAMAVIMAGLTLTTAVDDALHDLPLRPLLVTLSSLSAVVCAGVVAYGRHHRLVGWAGATFAVYCGLRSLLWLSTGSISGALAWQSGMLLGFVVFARRRTTHEGGGREG